MMFNDNALWTTFNPDDPEPTVWCDKCRCLYTRRELEDAIGHAVRHNRWLRGVRVLGRYPMTHREQEDAKSAGHRLVATAWLLSVRVEGALLVLRGHFERSLTRALTGNYIGMHPDFARYVGERDLMVDFPVPVVIGLRARYPQLEPTGDMDEERVWRPW